MEYRSSEIRATSVLTADKSKDPRTEYLMMLARRCLSSCLSSSSFSFSSLTPSCFLLSTVCFFLVFSSISPFFLYSFSRMCILPIKNESLVSIQQWIVHMLCIYLYLNLYYVHHHHHHHCQQQGISYFLAVTVIMVGGLPIVSCYPYVSFAGWNVFRE